MSQELLTYCIDQSRTQERSGASQLAGFVLTEESLRGVLHWRGLAPSRALLGHLTAQVVARRPDLQAHDDIVHATVWRGRRNTRRLLDLSHDLITGRKDHWALRGMSGAREGAPLTHAHIAALELKLSKRPQAQNMSRLFRLAERLASVFESPPARRMMAQFDATFAPETGAPDFFGWAVCARFHPLRFSRRLLGTQAHIASLFMSERDLLANAPLLHASDARAVRIALLIALRQLNEQMNWLSIGDAFPERLVMTQKDTKQARSDDPPGQGPHSLALLERVEALAARTTPTQEDPEIWAELRGDPSLFAHYMRARLSLEESAEDPLHHHTLEPTPSPLWSWWRNMTMPKGLLVALAITTLVALTWWVWTPQTVVEDPSRAFIPADLKPLTKEQDDAQIKEVSSPEHVSPLRDRTKLSKARAPVEAPEPSNLAEDVRRIEQEVDPKTPTATATKTGKSGPDAFERAQSEALQATYSAATQEATLKCLNGFVQRGKSFDGAIVLGLKATYDERADALSYELDRIDTRGSQNSPLIDFDRESYKCWSDALWEVTVPNPEVDANLLDFQEPVPVEISYSLKVKGKAPETPE